MANLGQLVVNLEANIASFTRDMNRASQQTDQITGRMNAAFDTVRSAVLALGAGATVGAIGVMVKASIDAADSLRDMSQMTGVAVENLNGLGFAAGQAGGSLESIAGAAGKLNKSVAEAAGGNKETSAAFKALGIDIQDASGKLKTADVVIAEIADRFQNYADGPEKSALALRLFGKAGADMIPLLNDGGDALRENMEYAKQYSGMTTELSNAADNFNDTMGKLTVQQKSFSNAIASAVLPVLQAVAEEMLGASEKANGFALAGEVVRTVLETFVVVGSEVAFTFKAVGTEIGGILAQLNRLAHADVKGALFIGDAMKRDAAIARKEHDAFIARVLDRTPTAVVATQSSRSKPAAPRLPGTDSATASKAILAGGIKEMDAAYALSQDAAKFHEQFMRDLRAQDVVDIATYEKFKVASIESGVAAAAKHYDAEIALLTRSRDAAASAAEKVELNNRINEKVAQKEKARIDALQAGALQTLGMSAAQASLNKEMKEWSIQQDRATSQLQFNNDLYGKSALEVAKLTAARQLQLEVEEKIRKAQEQGAISQEAIARFTKEASDKSKAANGAATKGVGLGIIQSLQTPLEAENLEHANKMRDLAMFRDEELAFAMEANQAIERENARHHLAETQARMLAGQQVVGLAGDSASQLYSIMQAAGMEQTALGKALFIANKAIAIAEIIMNTEVAAAKALTMGPIIGPPLAMAVRVMGYASAGIVLGTTIASAEDGYDIPGGVNPVTQLHEKEMVLPKAQADVIRGLASRGGGGPTVHQTNNIHIDSSTDQAKIHKLVVGAVQQGNADLVDRLQRAGRI